MDLTKQKTFRSKKYLEFVRGLPCAVCKKKDETVVPHHVDAGGVGMKCSDARVIPLCHFHHNEHDHIGKRTFYSKYGTSKNECLIETMQAYIEGGC